MSTENIIRLPRLMEMVGLSRTTIWRRVKSGELPPPVRLGGPGSRAVGWRKTAIEGWLRTRPNV